jgi:hypothetical protein
MRVIAIGKEIVAFAGLTLYAAFMFHLMFPHTYHATLEWITSIYTELVRRIQTRTDTTKLNQMWDAGGE